LFSAGLADGMIWAGKEEFSTGAALRRRSRLPRSGL